jgi:membrane associated rhomboid family serine protease
MLPISDDIRTRTLPVVTLALVIANVLLFLYELLLGPNAEALIQAWGAIPAHISRPGEYPLASLTLLTSMFLHGGWMHLVGNMLYLWIFGDNVEDRLGHLGFLLFYLAAGILAGLVQVLASSSSEIPAIGASGAVAAVLGVYLVLHPSAPVRVVVPGLYLVAIRRVPAVLVLGMWFGIQLLNGVLSLGTETAVAGVAWFAHIGGFGAGLFVGIVALLAARRTPAGNVTN